MSMPPEDVLIKCPNCGEIYKDWYRPSMNMDLDNFDEEYIEKASSATCPKCKHKVQLNSLIVSHGVFTFIGS